MERGYIWKESSEDREELIRDRWGVVIVVLIYHELGSS